MRTQVVEIDDDVYEVLTHWDNGSVTVDIYNGRDAYDRHMLGEMHDRGQAATGSDQAVLRYGQARRCHRTSWDWQDDYHEAGVPTFH